MKLEFKNVTKQYGEVNAVNKVNCVMEKGIYGLLGVNGAGKQSIRMVFLNFQFRRRSKRKLRPQSILLLKDKLNLNHLMRSRTGLWPGRLFKLKYKGAV